MRERDDSDMASFRLLIILVGVSILISVMVGMWISTSSPSVVGDGRLTQGPLTYVLLVVFLLVIGFVFSRMYNRVSSTNSFSFMAFINVGFAAIVIGGIIHEIVHMILLRHPTQFQVHFGDPVAIFSTCCLAPGELPQEEIAYGIQLLVMILWFFFNRGLIFRPTKSQTVSVGMPVNTIPATGIGNHPVADKEVWTEQSLEKEWEKSREEISKGFAQLDREQ